MQTLNCMKYTPPLHVKDLEAQYQVIFKHMTEHEMFYNFPKKCYEKFYTHKLKFLFTRHTIYQHSTYILQLIFCYIDHICLSLSICPSFCPSINLNYFGELQCELHLIHQL